MEKYEKDVPKNRQTIFSEGMATSDGGIFRNAKMKKQNRIVKLEMPKNNATICSAQ